MTKEYTDKEIQLFNAFCAKTMGWQRGSGWNIGSYYTIVHGVYAGSVEDYNPYDNIGQMQSVINILADTQNLRILSHEALFNSPIQAGRDAISKFMPPSETVPEALNKLADAVDAFHTPPPPITNFAYGLDYPDTNGEQEKFNTQCRGIMFQHAAIQSNGDVLLSKDYDPYYNGGELLNILEIVLQYVPDGIRFLLTGQKDKNTFDDVTWHIQQFIRSYGTDEWMMNEEQQFNKICKVLVDGYSIVDCQPIEDNFDPYNNIQDLAPILPIVARRVSENFTLGELMYDLPREESYNMNLFDNMRHYVQRHGQTLLGILEEDNEFC